MTLRSRVSRLKTRVLVEELLIVCALIPDLTTPVVRPCCFRRIWLLWSPIHPRLRVLVLPSAGSLKSIL